MLLEPIETWTEVGSAAANRIEVDRLAGFVRLHLLYLRIEVENMDTLRPLTFENRTHLRLE